MEERWVSRYPGEVIGTFVLVLSGCVAVLFGQASDLFSAELAWGFALALAMTAPR